MELEIHELLTNSTLVTLAETDGGHIGDTPDTEVSVGDSIPAIWERRIGLFGIFIELQVDAMVDSLAKEGTERTDLILVLLCKLFLNCVPEQELATELRDASEITGDFSGIRD